MKFYQESGNFNLMCLIVATVIIIPFTWILGYIYSIAIIIIPIVYLKNLCTIGLGIAIGMLCRILVRLTHSRPKKTYYVLAVIAGLFANYFQWTVLISYLYIGKI